MDPKASSQNPVANGQFDRNPHAKNNGGKVVSSLTQKPDGSQTTTITTQTNDPKPGYKTTEFWLTTAAVLLGALITTGAIVEESQIGKIAGAIVMTLSALGYTAGRSHVKATLAKPVVIIGALGLMAISGPGCEALRPMSADYVAADRATHDAIAPEYRAYVEADSTLSQTQIDRRINTLESWDFRIRRAENAGTLTPGPTTPSPTTPSPTTPSKEAAQ